MKLSNRIIQAALECQYKGINRDYDHSFTLDLPYLKSKITIAFNLIQKGEVIFEEVVFESELTSRYLGVIDMYIGLLQKRALEASDRINIKEFDYYCRDSKEVPAFEYYNNELYEILGIGEQVFKLLRPNENDKQTALIGDDVNFFELPFFEQIELLEEVLAIDLYNRPDYSGLEFVVDEIEDNNIYIQKNETANDKDLIVITGEVKKYLLPKKEFKLVFR